VKQVLNSLKTGVIEVADVPCPAVRPGHLLLRTRATLISAGTKRMLVEFGKASLLEKARQQPERVKMVLDKVRTDGLGPTLAAVSNKLDQPLRLGYCHVGEVLEVAPGVEGFTPGDRVVSNGGQAKVIAVPATLCARVPDRVSGDADALTVLGAGRPVSGPPVTTASALVPVLAMGPIGGGVGSARDDCRRQFCDEGAAIGMAADLVGAVDAIALGATVGVF